MKVLNHMNVRSLEGEDGSSKMRIRWLITKEMGAPNFAMRLFEIDPEGYSPYHKHSWEHEVFILEGEGTIRSEKGDRKFRKGDAIIIMPEEFHQFKNTSQETVKFICLVPFH